MHIVRARYFFLGPRELVSGDTPARVTDFILVLLCSSVRDNHATPSSAQWFFFLFRKREGMHVLGCERGSDAPVPLVRRRARMRGKKRGNGLVAYGV